MEIMCTVWKCAMFQKLSPAAYGGGIPQGGYCAVAVIITPRIWRASLIATGLRALLHRALFCCSAALPHGAVNWIQLISTGIFILPGGCLAARGKLGPWANSRRRCPRFGTNPPAGEAMPCVKVPFRLLATVPLPLRNSAPCKRSSGNGAARQRRAVLQQNSALCKSGFNGILKFMTSVCTCTSSFFSWQSHWSRCTGDAFIVCHAELTAGNRHRYQENSIVQCNIK